MLTLGGQRQPMQHHPVDEREERCGARLWFTHTQGGDGPNGPPAQAIASELNRRGHRWVVDALEKQRVASERLHAAGACHGLDCRLNGVAESIEVRLTPLVAQEPLRVVASLKVLDDPLDERLSRPEVVRRGPSWKPSLSVDSRVCEGPHAA